MRSGYRGCALLIILTLLYGFSCDTNPFRQLGSFSFKDPFFPDAGSAAIPGWEIKGSTLVMQDFVRLTPAENGRSGWITNRRPYFMSSVNATLAFRIHSHAANGGDGLAFWMSESPLKPGPIFAAADQWSGLVIIMDSWSNSGVDSTPQIAIHYNNGEKVFDFENDGASTLIKKCPSNYRNADISYLNVVYLDEKLSVRFDSLGNNNWVDCLNELPIDLPNRFFFSVSAMTGGLSDNHDVKSLIIGTHDSVGDRKVKKEKEAEDSAAKDANKNTQENTQNDKNQNDQANKDKKNKNDNDNKNTNNNNSNNNNNNNDNNNNINNNNNNNNNNDDIENKPLVLSPEYLEKEAQKKKEQIMSAFPNQEFWDHVQDDDEDIMGKIRNMRESFGHQLLDLQFSFRDQILEIKSDIPTTIAIYNELKQDIIKIEETLSKSGTIIGMVQKEIKALSSEPEVTKEVMNIVNSVDKKIKNIEESLQKLNNAVTQVQSEQKNQFDIEKAERQKNEGGSTMIPTLIVIIFMVVVVAIVAKFVCFPRAKKSSKGIL